MSGLVFQLQHEENMNYVKKGAWSPEEDQKLIDYIMKYRIWTWSQMPKFAGLSRTGKSCRLRWINYLRPGLKRGPFSMEEVETVIRMYQSLGNRWSAIARELLGRTDNEIKNFYHTHLKKHLGTKVKNVQVKPKARSKKTKKTKQITEMGQNKPLLLATCPIQKSASIPHESTNESYKISDFFETSDQDNDVTSVVMNQVEKIVILESNPDISTTSNFDFMDVSVHSSNNMDFWLELYMAADNLKI